MAEISFWICKIFFSKQTYKMSQKLLLINPYKSSMFKSKTSYWPSAKLCDIEEKLCNICRFFHPLRKQALSLVSCRAVWFLIFYLKGKDFSPLSVCPHTTHFKTILHLGQLPEFIPLNGQLSWYNLYASYPCLIAFLCQVPKKTGPSIGRRISKSVI